MKKIACLPIAGISNPYQYLMMQGLDKMGLTVVHGCPGKFFVFARTSFCHKPDIIHLDWLHQYYLRRSDWLTWLNFPLFILDILITKYIFRIKLVWTLHNIVPHDKPYHGPYRWSRIFFAKHCDWIRVFYQNTIIRASVHLGVGPSKFKVVPEGSYVNYYRNQITKEDARRKLGIPSDKKIALYLGLVKKYKGVHDLVEIFQNVGNRLFHLIIAGKAHDESYAMKIASQLGDNITWDNRFIPESELETYFNAADIVVLPFNKIENSGSVILAMSFKKAVVAPRMGVVAERLKQQDQLLFDEGGLQKALNHALTFSNSELIQIGQLNFESLSKFGWEDFSSCFK